MSHTEDRELEEKWREVTLTVPFKRSHETGELILHEDWWIFKAKTKRKDIWRHFDEKHSKGIGHLLRRIAWWKPEDEDEGRHRHEGEDKHRHEGEGEDRHKDRRRGEGEDRHDDGRRGEGKDRHKDKGEDR